VITIVLLVALVLSFLLSGMESAVLSVSRVRVRHAANDDTRAAQLLPLLEDREGLLGSVTVANHVVNVSAFGLIIWRLVQGMGQWGYAIGFLLALPVFIVGLEVLPKTLFRRYPYRTLRRLVPLLRLVALFRTPFKAMSAIRLLPDEAAERAASSREDLKRLLGSMATDKILTASAARLMERVIDFRPLTVAQVMVPLTKIVAVGPDMPASAALELARQNGFTVMPVLGESGAYSGVFDACTLPAYLPPDRLVRQHMRPMEEVDSSLGALVVLQRLRRRGVSLAMVVDMKRHSPVGLVTEEDLIRPLI
jgi:CBS domain containing-hemolysin-like protein